MFEDAPNGVKAAKSAGMRCVMVPHPEIDRDLCQDADQVIDSLEKFNFGEWEVAPLAKQMEPS